MLTCAEVRLVLPVARGQFCSGDFFKHLRIFVWASVKLEEAESCPCFLKGLGKRSGYFILTLRSTDPGYLKGLFLVFLNPSKAQRFVLPKR